MKYSSVFEILQIQPSQLKHEILREKNPIIIENSVDDLDTLVKKSLKYLYLYTLTCPNKFSNTDNLRINFARYMMIRNTSDKTSFEIEIVHPKHKNKENYKFVSIIIHPSNILILPMFWKYKWVKYIEHKECLFVHDIFSSIYHTFSTIL